MFEPAAPTQAPGTRQDRVDKASCAGTVNDIFVRKGCTGGLKAGNLDSAVHIRAWLAKRPQTFNGAQQSTNTSFVCRRIFTAGQPNPPGFGDSLLLPDQCKDLLTNFADSVVDGTFTDLKTAYATATNAGRYLLMGMIRQVVEAKSSDLGRIYKGFQVTLPAAASKVEGILANWQKVSPELFKINIGSDLQGDEPWNRDGARGQPEVAEELSTKERALLNALLQGTVQYDATNQYMVGAGIGGSGVVQYLQQILERTAPLSSSDFQVAIAAALKNVVFAYKRQGHEAFGADSEALSQCQKDLLTMMNGGRDLLNNLLRAIRILKICKPLKKVAEDCATRLKEAGTRDTEQGKLNKKRGSSNAFGPEDLLSNDVVEGMQSMLKRHMRSLVAALGPDNDPTGSGGSAAPNAMHTLQDLIEGKYWVHPDQAYDAAIRLVGGKCVGCGKDRQQCTTEDACYQGPVHESFTTRVAAEESIVNL